MDMDKLIEELLDELGDVVKQNATVRKRLARIIKKHLADDTDTPRKSQRRKPGPFDPMAVHRDSPEQLQTRLQALDLEQLKDIVAEHGMDRSKLAMKWKTKDRLVELIVSTVISRSQKGDAFRAQE